MAAEFEVGASVPEVLGASGPGLSRSVLGGETALPSPGSAGGQVGQEVWRLGEGVLDWG